MSGNNATIVLPAFSSRLASSIAAARAAPEEIPTRIPSVLAISFAFEKAASLAIGRISSYTFVSRVSGTKPAPIP